MRQKTALWFAALAALTIAALIASVTLGAVPISFWRAVEVLARPNGDDWEHVVIWSLRFPRALVAWMVGAALSLSGCALQGIFSNPLADPGVLGVSSAAALGAVVAVFFGLAAEASWCLPLAACLGAGAATLALLTFARQNARLELGAILLGGVAIGNVAVAGCSLIVSLALKNYAIAQELLIWLLGDLAGRTWLHVAWAIGPFWIGTWLVMASARGLDALLIDEIGAAAVGVDVGRLRLRLILGVSVLTGASVAIGGAIGFVGLIVPHVMRRWVGPLHGVLLPAVLFAGGAFVMIADLVARRLLAPEEMRLGIVTAAIGAPLFLYLLVRRERWA